MVIAVNRTIIAALTLALSGLIGSPASADDTWHRPPADLSGVLKVDGQRVTGYGFSVVNDQGVEHGYPDFRTMRRYCRTVNVSECRWEWAVFYWQLRVFRDEHGGSMVPSWMKDAQPR